MKNLIFIPNIDKGQGSKRHEPYHFSINSWKRWADKNNCEVLVMDQSIYDPSYMTVPWQRYHLFDILDSNGITDFDQVAMADADTIIHPECPNFFNFTEHKYVGVVDQGCMEWTGRSIRLYQDLYPEIKLDRGLYINGGFQVINKTHRPFFNIVLDFYKKNSAILLEKQKQKLGTDQTNLSYLLQTHKIEQKIFPYTYNMHHLVSKNLLNFGNSWWGDSLENLYSQGWIYHLNAIPQNNLQRYSYYWMERIHRELYGTI